MPPSLFAPLRRTGLPLLVAGSLAACSGPDGETATFAENAQFRRLSLTVSADFDGLRMRGGRRQVVEVDVAGALRHVDQDERFQSQLSPEAVKSLGDLVTSVEVVKALRGNAQASCGTIVERFNETIAAEIGPGLFVKNEIGGCFTGPLAALRTAIRNLVKAQFPTTTFDARSVGLVGPALRPIVIPDVTRRAGFHERARLISFWLGRGNMSCGYDCAVGIGVDPERRRGVESEIEALARVVTSRPYVEAMRGTPACPPSIGQFETMQAYVMPGVYLEAQTGGCTAGPIAAARTAAEAPYAAHNGHPPLDAGTPDHPADLRGLLGD